jgi:hypothetical protein
MHQLIRAAILPLCCLAAQASAEPWGRWHEASQQQPAQPPAKQAVGADDQPETYPGIWKCESATWSINDAGNATKAESASSGPYDKDGHPTATPTDHGAFSAVAFTRPGAALVNSSCSIESSEPEDYHLPVGVAITRSSAETQHGVQGWRCSALLPYYTDPIRKTVSMKIPKSDHLPDITVNAAVSYCFYDVTQPGDIKAEEDERRAILLNPPPRQQ